MKIGPNSKLMELKSLVKANIEKEWKHPVNDADLYEALMVGLYDTLEGLHSIPLLMCRRMKNNRC